MKFSSFAEVRAKLAEAIEAAQGEDVVILVRGKPAARLVGLRGASIDDLVSEDKELFALIRERQRDPKFVTSEAVGAKLAARVAAEKTKPRARTAASKRK